MNGRRLASLPFFSGLLLLAPLVLASAESLAAPQCRIERFDRNPPVSGSRLDHANWLAPEFLRFSLQTPETFMPRVEIRSATAPSKLPVAPRRLDLARVQATDPLDMKARSLVFLLESRLYADGLLVLHNGRVLAERYWHGLPAKQPRLLLEGTRPVLSLLGAIGAAQGKLMPEKSLAAHVQALGEPPGLRKMSVQRLIEANGRFEWSAQELAAWRAESGWGPGGSGKGVRAWLARPELWEKSHVRDAFSPAAGPEGDLLAWALAEKYNKPLAQVFCDNLYSRLGAEYPALWLTDGAGTELSAGLALSLRDWARLGQVLVEPRLRGSRSVVPNWFVETLTASAGARKPNPPALAGLRNGSEYRYGFVHLGGRAGRVALIGPHGNSLYVDVDRRLVVALFAAHPGAEASNPALLATLEQVWDALAAASQPVPAAKAKGA
ncbi:hypothetical protein [Propionivibrio limicola]|uniref:hypothetical protein n=1 Tax=Propionivibrio limicola TaxID=167645 RepID=UPI001291678B|nr:hypothetical protein [Propionivibrio limicola]